MSRKEQFAELLARGRTMQEIRERMGLTNSAAQGLMTRLRVDLGWQAR